MKKQNILKCLEGTGIHQEPDYVVPINGKARQLPYMVVRTDETVQPADAGRVLLTMTQWTVALFTGARDLALECKVIKALAGVGLAAEVYHYPDGTPYQTNFEFTTKSGGLNNE